MTLKIIFLGSGSAFYSNADNYQSNMLITVNGSYLLFDAGSDVRHALRDQGLNHLDITDVYISHLHADHIGGLEWLALTSRFDPSYQGKPNLYTSNALVEDIWESSLKGGLRTIQTEISTLSDFFNTKGIKGNRSFVWKGVKFTLVQMVHVVSGFELMPCYGLIFEYGEKRIFITADTQFCPTQLYDFYNSVDIIFHDCETSKNRSGVHAHYEELINAPNDIKNKMWLYHYNEGTLPDAKSDGFLGFVKKGQTFVFEK